MQKEKVMFGPGSGSAADLDPELEAAYQQFGRALGETPRETARIVQGNLGTEPKLQQLRGPRGVATQSQRPKQR